MQYSMMLAIGISLWLGCVSTFTLPQSEMDKRKEIFTRYVIIVGDQGWTETRLRGQDGFRHDTIIDARSAIFRQNNSSVRDPTHDKPCGHLDGRSKIQRYPVVVEQIDGRILWRGGVWLGETPQNSDWRSTYCNSAALEFKDPEEDVLVDGVQIQRVWDGIRFNHYCTSCRSIIRNAWIILARDDAIELDGMSNAVIESSLLDGVFVGISSDNRRGENRRNSNLIEVRNSLIRVEEFVFSWRKDANTRVDGYQVPIKWDARAPALRVTGTVIAFDNWNSALSNRWTLAWTAILDGGDCQKNHLLWLSDTSPPWDRASSFYGKWPKPPACFALLSGKPAREFWLNAKHEWIKNRKFAAQL